MTSKDPEMVVNFPVSISGTVFFILKFFTNRLIAALIFFFSAPRFFVEITKALFPRSNVRTSTFLSTVPSSFFSQTKATNRCIFFPPMVKFFFSSTVAYICFNFSISNGVSIYFFPYISPAQKNTMVFLDFE